MGTPSGLDVALGYAKADLRTFTREELKQTIDHLVHLVRPVLSGVCPSKKISQHIHQTRFDHRLIGVMPQSPLLKEYALELGSNETHFGKRISEGIQVYERTTITELFLTKNEGLILWEVKYTSRLTRPTKWVSRIESEQLSDITGVLAHPEINAELVRNCIGITSMTLHGFREERRKQLSRAEEVAVSVARLASSCFTS